MIRSRHCGAGRTHCQGSPNEGAGDSCGCAIVQGGGRVRRPAVSFCLAHCTPADVQYWHENSSWGCSPWCEQGLVAASFLFLTSSSSREIAGRWSSGISGAGRKPGSDNLSQPSPRSSWGPHSSHRPDGLAGLYPRWIYAEEEKQGRRPLIAADLDVITRTLASKV